MHPVQIVGQNPCPTVFIVYKLEGLSPKANPCPYPLSGSVHTAVFCAENFRAETVQNLLLKSAPVLKSVSDSANVLVMVASRSVLQHG